MKQWKKMGWQCLLVWMLLLGVSFQSRAENVEETLTGHTAYEGDDTVWEEEYTDTDVRRGMLAVRTDAFESFHGTVRAVFQKVNGKRTWTAELNEETNYLANLTLPVGTYRLAELEAVSGGREFDCSSEPMEANVGDGETVLWKITVTPNSLYRLPYEETELSEGIVTEEISEGDSREKESSHSEADVPEEAGKEENIKKEPERSGGIPIFLAVGLLGMAACTGSLFYMLKRNREGG